MDNVLSWLEASQERLLKESKTLAADDRRDESDLAKVRANVYGICKSVFQVLDREKAEAKIAGLHTEWEQSRTAALAHDDGKKALIEEIKLEALKEIEEHMKNMGVV